MHGAAAPQPPVAAAVVDLVTHGTVLLKGCLRSNVGNIVTESARTQQDGQKAPSVPAADLECVAAGAALLAEVRSWLDRSVSSVSFQWRR